MLLTSALLAAAVLGALLRPALSRDLAAAPPGSAPPRAFPGASPLAMAYVWSVDNSSATVPTAAWAPALLTGAAWNVYGWAGLMPRLLPDGSAVNGGIPQRGNVTLHLEKLARDLARILPRNASGACLLDWEFWRCEWNYTGAAYQSASLQAAAEGLPPGAPPQQVLAAATQQWQAGTRAFYEASLAAVQAWYPGCLVGMYAYPSNDWSTGGYVGSGAAARRAENDALAWLWRASSALYPSIYLTSPGASKYDGQTTEQYVGSTVREALRLASSVAAAAPAAPAPAPAPLVLPLAWYVYDAFPRPAVWQVLTAGDTAVVAALPSQLGADALVVWGAVGNPPFAPQPLARYLEDALGPALNASYAAALSCASARCSGQSRCTPSGGCAPPPQ
jgi:hyaluronoglucosaminidase